ncbi:MAG: hypothetical protein WA951_10900 [Leeuwenhoekiella sp.]
MKKLIHLLAIVLLGTTTMTAATSSDTYEDINRYGGNQYIFLEGGIEFSVYPDGEFDFVRPQAVSGFQLNTGNSVLSLSFNSGYNYDAFVQYDNYGAVIQIGNVPVYYDNWGRIAQAGNIAINYNNNYIAAIGGLQIFYRGNTFSYTRGFINPYNRNINYG